MAIIGILQRDGFDPEATQILCTAFDDAERRLGIAASTAIQAAAARERLASLVIGLFAGGEQDSGRLADKALAAMTARDGARERLKPSPLAGTDPACAP